jgi:predicted flap endonuclease-1-like 5' DNA nuclease
MRRTVASCVLMLLLPACANAPLPMAAMAPAAVAAAGTFNSYRADAIEGIGPAYAAKLKEVGITNTSELLAKLSTRKERTTIAEKTGISDKRLLSWANKADLMRIKGIGPQMSDLLEAIGVNTVPQLAQRADFVALREKMRFANEIGKAFVQRVPPDETVHAWIEAAKKTERAIEY